MGFYTSAGAGERGAKRAARLFPTEQRGSAIIARRNWLRPLGKEISEMPLPIQIGAEAAMVLLAMAYLLVKHAAADLILQTETQRREKGIYGATGGLTHSPDARCPDRAHVRFATRCRTRHHGRPARGRIRVALPC